MTHLLNVQRYVERVQDVVHQASRVYEPLQHSEGIKANPKIKPALKWYLSFERLQSGPNMPGFLGRNCQEGTGGLIGWYNAKVLNMQGSTKQWTHWVDCAAHHPAKRVPSSVVEPVPHVVKAILCEVLRDSVVEVWIELVDDALVLNHREQADCRGHDTYT